MTEDPRRREDDRLDQLVSQLTSLVATVAVVANDIGYLKAQSQANAGNIREALNKVNAMSADAEASPAGRDILRRLTDIEGGQREDRRDIEALQTFTTELRGSFRTLRGMTTVVSVIGTLASALWLFHGLHLFGL